MVLLRLLIPGSGMPRKCLSTSSTLLYDEGGESGYSLGLSMVYGFVKQSKGT